VPRYAARELQQREKIGVGADLGTVQMPRQQLRGREPCRSMARARQFDFFSAQRCTILNMRKVTVPLRTKQRNTQVPVFVEKDENGFYVVGCPLFEGCYSQGKTLDEALRNIREVIRLVAEERRNRDILRTYHPKEVSLHTITL